MKNEKEKIINITRVEMNGQVFRLEEDTYREVKEGIQNALGKAFVDGKIDADQLAILGKLLSQTLE